MPWTEAARREYRRAGARYASDMTDREWVLVAPFMPPARRLGRPRTTDLREVMNAILYIATTGCQWVQLPKDFPPYSTVQRYFYDWRDSGLLQTIRFALAMETRELEGREASPSAAIIDSQSQIAVSTLYGDIGLELLAQRVQIPAGIEAQVARQACSFQWRLIIPKAECIDPGQGQALGLT